MVRIYFISNEAFTATSRSNRFFKDDVTFNQKQQDKNTSNELNDLKIEDPLETNAAIVLANFPMTHEHTFIISFKGFIF